MGTLELTPVMPSWLGLYNPLHKAQKKDKKGQKGILVTTMLITDFFALGS
jgi:hypothetical protein